MSIRESANSVFFFFEKFVKLVDLFFLFTYNVNYVIYTDDEVNKDGDAVCYASTYVLSPKGNMTKLKPVETKEEFDFISKILDSLEGGK